MPKLVLLLAGTAAVTAATSQVMVDTTLPRSMIDGDEYTATPNGYILSHCVYEVPHNAESRRHPTTGELQVFDSSGSFIQTVSACRPKVNKNNPILRSSGHAAPGTVKDLPADYNGWLQYTAFHNASGFDVFTSTMSVPDHPKEVPQILYLFPGLQNIDWIPKVDPEPTEAFDIIQPVLQYPGEGLLGHKWGVRSWYVTVNEGALMSTLKTVEAGDSIICNMTRLGDDSWFIGSEIASSGVQTNQKATAPRLKTQPWAYNTVECYGCRDCTTYPDNDFTIGNCEISSFTEGPADIVWESNPKPAEKLLCSETTNIKDAETVVFSFQA